MAAEGQGRVWAQMFALAENTNMRAYNDYDEHSTMGFYLCRTIEASGFGRRSPDLAGSAAGPIICPGGSAVRGGGDLINRHVEVLQMHCRPPPLCHLPDPRFTTLVAQWVGSRSLVGSGIASTAGVGVVPPVYTAPAGACGVDHSDLLHIFPNNWRATQ
jgi:hypothetical protein